MATSPFRITPSLGPGLRQTGVDYYWDTINPNVTAPSYQLGSKVIGNDGHEYVHVRATAALAANARFDVNDTTWATTASGTGAYMAPVAVAAGQPFHARLFAL